MNKKGSAVVILVIIVVILLTIGLFWCYIFSKSKIAPSTTINLQSAASSTILATATRQAVASSSFLFSCPDASTTAYEDSQMGVAFCYPSDLIVTTNSISWPNVSSTKISFWVLHAPSAMTGSATKLGSAPTLFYYLAACDASGANGEDYCVFPTPNEIITGKNQNGFNYIFFRHDIDHSNEGEGYGVVTISQRSAGPSAFIPLVNEKYLMFAVTNSLFQPVGFESLPTSTDVDLKEILNTMSIMPQQYTGVGLTLTTDAFGDIAVYNVIANSPAKAAGIKAGDIITRFNGTSTAEISFDSVTHFLDTTTGTVVLDVRGGGDQTSTPISLTPATLMVSGSDSAAMYEKPF
jgi:hypothetical protein